MLAAKSMSADSNPLGGWELTTNVAVAAEVPVVVVDVMRGGPSTGIPAKSEQSDVNIALYGLHGDAPSPAGSRTPCAAPSAGCCASA